MQLAAGEEKSRNEKVVAEERNLGKFFFFFSTHIWVFC